MKRIALTILGGMLLLSCGDTASGPGERAGDRYNTRSTAGSTEIHNEMEEDTTSEEENFHPKQKGGSTPADGKGNWWGKDD